MDTIEDTNSLKIPFRIRIGVFGATSLTKAEADAAEVGINEVLDKRIFTLYGKDSAKLKSEKLTKTEKPTPVAFTAATALAGDAERLLANVVLHREQGAVDVILPCSRTDFVREFVPTESRAHFETLFSQSRRPVNLNVKMGLEKLTGTERTKARRGVLVQTAYHVVDVCDMLVVVPGESDDDVEIAARVVEYAKTKQRPMIRIPLHASSEVTTESGQILSASAMAGLDVFNIFAVTQKEQEKYVASIEKDLFVHVPDVDEVTIQNVHNYLLPYYVRASRLAKANQKQYQRAGLLVYSFSATAVAAVALGTLVHKLTPWAFGFELLLLLAILITVFWADRKRTHNKWIECRFLAERLRAAEFLALCGVEVTPIQAPSHLGALGQADDWTLMAFNEIWQRLPVMKGCDSKLFPQLKEFIRQRWIEKQIEYHNIKSGKSRNKSRRLERGGLVIFSLALLAAALHLAFYFLGNEWLEAPITFAAIVLPAVGAAIGGIRTHREYSRLAKRSENMVQSLTELKDNLDRATSTGEFEALLREIEQLMLIETQDWLMLMRFAKLETAA